MKTAPFVFLFLVCAITPSFSQSWRWMQSSAPASGWTNIAMSADGSRLTAVSCGGLMYSSTNYGATWASNSPPNPGLAFGGWVSVASSANGSVLIAVPLFGYTFASTNGGSSWAWETASPQTSWYSVACSADGARILGAASSGVYFSTNFGQSFNQLLFPRSGAALGADGMVGIVIDGGGTEISTNFETTWFSLNQDIGDGQGGGGVSADGRTIALWSSPGISISTNWGKTLTFGARFERAENGPSFALSADGRKIFVAGADTSNILYSTDSGATWATNATPVMFNSIACSADGNRLAASQWLSHSSPNPTNYIFTAYVPSAPELSFAFVTNALNLSWVVPSTNMVLQWSPDLENWNTLTNAPSLNLNNLQEQLSVQLTGNCNYFRLISQ